MQGVKRLPLLLCLAAIALHIRLVSLCIVPAMPGPLDQQRPCATQHDLVLHGSPQLSHAGVAYTPSRQL